MQTVVFVLCALVSFFLSSATVFAIRALRQHGSIGPLTANADVRLFGNSTMPMCGIAIFSAFRSYVNPTTIPGLSLLLLNGSDTAERELSKIISLVARYVIDAYCLSGSLCLLVIRYDRH